VAGMTSAIPSTAVFVDAAAASLGKSGAIC